MNPIDRNSLFNGAGDTIKSCIGIHPRMIISVHLNWSADAWRIYDIGQEVVEKAVKGEGESQ